MSEEIHNPSVVVPRSIMLSILLNGTTGFAMMIAVLFCLGNLENALTTKTGFPFLEIFLQATNSVAGSAAMAAIVTSLAVCATVGLLASTSRMFWSFARDHGLPFWRTLEKVNCLPLKKAISQFSTNSSPRSILAPPFLYGLSPLPPLFPVFCLS
jgi:amino acid transporter